MCCSHFDPPISLSSFNTSLDSCLIHLCSNACHVFTTDELSKWTSTIQSWYSLWYSPIVCSGWHKSLISSCEKFLYLSSSPWCRDVQVYPGPNNITVERGVQHCLLFCYFWKHEGIFHPHSCEVVFCCVSQRLVQVYFSVCLIFPPSPPPFSAPVVMQHDGLMAFVLLL